MDPIQHWGPPLPGEQASLGWRDLLLQLFSVGEVFKVQTEPKCTYAFICGLLPRLGRPQQKDVRMHSSTMCLAAEPGCPTGCQCGCRAMNALISTAEGDEDRESLCLLVLTNANQCSGLYPHICIDPLLKIKSKLQDTCVLVQTLTL